MTLSRVVDRGTALGTEAKRELRSFISYSNVLRCCTGNLDSRTIETSLFPEHATRSLLTRETVTNRDPKRLPLHFDLNLPTRTRRSPCTHHTASRAAATYCHPQRSRPPARDCESQAEVRCFTPGRCGVLLDLVNISSRAHPTTAHRAVPDCIVGR